MTNSRTLLIKNTYTSIAYQLVTILCGFIVPRLILGSFGTEAYGLVGSVASFLSLISYLDLGMTAVVQSALYKPLADNDNYQISTIMCSSNIFFKNIARLLVGYVFVLIFIYPVIVDTNFSRLYVGSIILAISISSFSQYYFGITNQLLLCAHQRLYISNYVQICTLILNTISCAVLLWIGCSIQIVYFASSIIFIIRPLYYWAYVRKHYQVDFSLKLDYEPIKQKWNGVSQHVATVVMNSSNTLFLSLFSSLSNVAIYNVYYLVVGGINKLFYTSTAGFQSYYGELWAKNKTEELNNSFNFLSWCINTSVVFVFGCASVLITPFILVYTNGVNDANYNVPVFGLYICLAYAFYTLRLPFNLVILACNHYKQTQNSYVVATIINICIAIVGVYFGGLNGVTLGIMSAMLYQTIWMAWYISKNLLKRRISLFIKQMSVNIISFIVPYYICNSFFNANLELLGWILMSFKTALIWSLWILIINSFFYSLYINTLLQRINIFNNGFFKRTV